MNELETLFKMIALNRNLDEMIAERKREQEKMLAIFDVAVKALRDIFEEGLTAEEAGMTAAVALDKIELLVKING